MQYLQRSWYLRTMLRTSLCCVLAQEDPGVSHGEHTCPVTRKTERPKDDISRQLRENPDLTPSQIQSNLIMSQLRQGIQYNI